MPIDPTFDTAAAVHMVVVVVVERTAVATEVEKTVVSACWVVVGRMVVVPVCETVFVLVNVTITSWGCRTTTQTARICSAVYVFKYEGVVKGLRPASCRRALCGGIPFGSAVEVNTTVDLTNVDVTPTVVVSTWVVV